MVELTRTSFVLKHRPEDFRVRENVVLPLTGEPGAQYRYVLLHKCGYTTMEAMRLLAQHCGLSIKDIGYAGLKDEDGITEQLLSIPASAGAPSGVLSTEAPDRVVRCEHYGYGGEPLIVGGLNGNGFRVVMRDLNEEVATRLATRRRMNLLFINYYDTQRFGVPGGPRRTHLVGAAVLAGDWALALDELAGLAAPESAAAAAWSGPAEEFFTGLDPRTVAFYLSAHSSAQWNATARDLVRRHCDPVIEEEVDGLPYLFPVTETGVAALLAACHELPYMRYSYRNGPVEHLIQRPTVVQAVVSMDKQQTDDHFPGKHSVQATFQLPTGCYATTALRQLIAQS